MKKLPVALRATICVIVSWLLFLPLLITILLVITSVPSIVKEGRMKRQLESTPLPPRTELVEIVTATKPNISGDAMNYLASALMKSELSHTELRDFYRSYPVTIGYGESDGSIAFDYDKWLNAIGLTADFEALEELTTTEGYYVIYIFDSRDEMTIG